MIAVGCGNNNQTDPRNSLALRQDPEGEFQWGMTRLERALRLFRPSSSQGLATQRNLEYELFPPTDLKPNYTAQVTIISETSFLHGQRESLAKEEKKPNKPEIKLNDPLAPKPDEYVEMIDIPGVGPGAPPVAPPQIDTRSLDTKSVFEMEYVEGKWKLREQPDLKHEQLWFEYAFE